MASPEERLALLEQQLTVMAHQLLAMQLQTAELAVAVYRQGTPQARAAPRHSDFNVGATYGVPANFGDSEPENVEGSATASDARIGAPSSRPANRRSKKLRDRSRQRAERSTAVAVSDSEREVTGRDGNAHVCTHCHGIGLIATDCWTKAGGEKARDRVVGTNAGSTAPGAAGSAAQSATEPMQIALSDLNMESLFITALDVEDERSAPLEGAVPRKWAAAMGALSPTQAREALSSLEVAAPYSSSFGQSDLPNQPWPGDPMSFGRQANQP